MPEDIEKIRRAQKINRILLLIVMILLICILIGACVAGLYVYRLTQQFIPVARKFQEVDWTYMYDQFTALNVPELKKKMDAMAESLQSIAEIFDAISAGAGR